jgi:hypothetical protein
MNDPLFVRGCECLRNLPCNWQDLVDRHRATRDSLGQVFPGHELHDEGMYVARLFETEDLRDVRVIQRREGLGLTLETGHAIRVGRERFWQNLDGDDAIEARIAGSVHLAHPACADGRGDLVDAETGTGGKGQRCGL